MDLPYYTGPENGGGFIGAMDEICFWSHARSAEQINSDMKLTLYKGEVGYDPADQLHVKTGISFNADASTVIDLTDSGDGDPTVSRCQTFHFKVENSGSGWRYNSEDAYADGRHLSSTSGFAGDGDLRFQVKIAPVPVFGVDVDYIRLSDNRSSRARPEEFPP